MQILIGSCISIINGCTDSIALKLANFDDGSCCFNIGQIDNEIYGHTNYQVMTYK